LHDFFKTNFKHENLAVYSFLDVVAGFAGGDDGEGAVNEEGQPEDGVARFS